jgi:hypothetical protein
LERGTFELGSTTGKNSAYEGSGQFRVSDFSKLVFNE